MRYRFTHYFYGISEFLCDLFYHKLVKNFWQVGSSDAYEQNINDVNVNDNNAMHWPNITINNLNAVSPEGETYANNQVKHGGSNVPSK